MTFEEVLKYGESELSEVIEEARTNAWFLFEYVFSMDRARFYLDGKKAAPEKEVNAYYSLIEKRKERIPLQHLTGVQNFMGFDFKVGPEVLIPRSETELLVSEVIKESEGKKVLDLCTGSGCIAVSISLLGKPKLIHASDISSDALKVAKENAKELKADVTFIESNMFEDIFESYDIIVSNPPYISGDEIKTLEPEVRFYDPYEALFGGEDGYIFYEEIARESYKYLNPNGRLMLEIGYNQAKKVKELLSDKFTDIKVIKDYAGLDRMIVCSLSS